MAKDVMEIRWHARGGQGAVTAAKTLAEMSLTKNMYFQAFPEYGPERMGAPIQCFNRISKKKISTYCGITQPDIVVVVDPSLLGVVDITAGVSNDGIIIVNTTDNPQTIRKRLNLNGQKLFVVDATHISLKSLGRFMPNIPMLGAVLKVTGLLEKEEAIDFLKESFGKKFPVKVVENNIKALEEAFREVKGE
ncbi:MAG: pyruvate synthase [Firmicutes bacterium]|jgi:pyruvate ferredoxin oxidoreductase gamma subunit|nr:pyruvate synthase [Bacillota bacterium]